MSDDNWMNYTMLAIVGFALLLEIIYLIIMVSLMARQEEKVAQSKLILNSNREKVKTKFNIA